MKKGFKKWGGGKDSFRIKLGLRQSQGSEWESGSFIPLEDDVFIPTFSHLFLNGIRIFMLLSLSPFGGSTSEQVSDEGREEWCQGFK